MPLSLFPLPNKEKGAELIKLTLIIKSPNFSFLTSIILSLEKHLFLLANS